MGRGDDASDTFPALLVCFRRRLGVTQRAFAKHVGISASHLNHIEKGRRNPPPLEVLRSVIAVLRLDPNEAQQLLEAAGHDASVLARPLRTALSGPMLDIESPWPGVSDAAFRCFEDALLALPAGQREQYLATFTTLMEIATDHLA